MVSDLINVMFARPLEQFCSGTVVVVYVSTSDGDKLVWSDYVKEKSGTWQHRDMLKATRVKVRRLYTDVLRAFEEQGIGRSRIRRESNHRELILKAIRRSYERSYDLGEQYDVSCRVDWDSSREVGDRLSLISESNSPIGGSDVAG